MDDNTAKRKPGKRKVQLYLPPELYRELRVHAARNDTSASALAEAFLREGLAKQGATT